MAQARMGSGGGSMSERAIAAHNAMATPELGTWTPERHWSRARCIHTGCSCPCCLETCPVCYVSEDDMQTESDAESDAPPVCPACGESTNDGAMQRILDLCNDTDSDARVDWIRIEAREALARGGPRAQVVQHPHTLEPATRRFLGDVHALPPGCP